jgi:hypothetical protein
MVKLADKLDSVNDAFTINRYDNGFMIEVGGKDANGDWKTAKLLCNTEEELITLVREAINMRVDD